MPEEKDFMIEKIKERPVNKKKLMRRTLITAAMAVIFGLIACFTFLVLEPIISKWLYPEEPPQIVLFPEDQEEMSPEEMLSDTMQSMQELQSGQNNHNSSNPSEPKPPTQSGNVTLQQEQIQKILDKVVLDQDNYRELYTALSGYVEELNQSMVTVTGISSDVDWLNNVMESSNQASGVIVANNGKELLMLADYEPIMNAEMLMVAFHNGLQVEAYIKQQDKITELCIVAVELEGLSEEYLEDLEIVTLGTSNTRNLPGMPVIVLGNPMGISSSLGYGMITGETQRLAADSRYKVLQTDIYGSQNPGGFLFNLSGQLIGVITDYKPASDMKNMIAAYGISDLRKLIEKMSNQTPVPYLGITGMDVTNQINTQLKVPFGTYVKEVTKDSPAMLAGIQRGDVIVKIGKQSVQNFSGYITVLMQMEAGQTADITLMRLVQEEYKEMTLSITLGESGSGK